MATPLTRTDPLTGDRVKYSPDRASRPGASTPEQPPEIMPVDRCPFCPDTMKDPITDFLGKDVESWDVCSVPNVYPGVSMDEPDRPLITTNEFWNESTARGRHELVIVSRDHNQHWAKMSAEEAILAFRLIQRRAQQLSSPELPYSLCTWNNGSAAAQTLWHKHVHVLGLEEPANPEHLQIIQRAKTRAKPTSRIAAGVAASGVRSYIEGERDEVLARRKQGPDLVIHAGDEVTAWLPFASRHKYEVRITANTPQRFEHARSETIEQIAIAFRNAVAAIAADPISIHTFNATIYSGPEEQLLVRIFPGGRGPISSGLVENLTFPEHAAPLVRENIRQLSL